MPSFAVSIITLLGIVGAVDAFAVVRVITPAPALPTSHPLLQARASSSGFSTCGYVDGDPSKPRIAPPGFNCRVDTANGLWGFCPTTVLVASDCGLGGFCFDAGPCSTGCGRASLRNNPKITTWRCPEFDDVRDAKFCTTESLIFGPDQTYDYVDCATNPGRQNVFFSPNAAASLTSRLSSPSSAVVQTTGASNLNPPVAESPSQTHNGTPLPTGDIGTNNTKPETSPSISTGVIIGSTLGGLALLLGFGVMVVYILRNNLNMNCGRRLRGDNDKNASQQEDKMASMTASEIIMPKPWEPCELAGERPPGELPVNPGMTSRYFAELPGENVGSR